MLKTNTLLQIVICSILFTVLFHNHSAGLNLIIFEFILITWLIFTGIIDLRNNNVVLLFSGVFITGVFTLITYSTYIYTVHFFLSFVFTGLLIYPHAKSLVTSFRLSFYNIRKAQLEFFREISEVQFRKKSPALFLWNSRLIVVPILITTVFISMYNYSNPKFNELTAGIFTGLIDFLYLVFKNYDLTLVFTIIWGVLISNFIFKKKPDEQLILNDRNSSDLLGYYRTQIFLRLNKLQLRNEIVSGILLMLLLNFILLVLNIIDIKWVWFGFEWEGQYLKQFVHEGTYMLIATILISIAIVLYFFRGGINYASNNTLKYLCYFWLSQNIILATSVAIRNFYYIQHYNLAYRRIGVIIFLIITIYGLFSVIIKVKKKYSSFYLFRTNFNAILVVLTVSSLFNWDSFIAKYNFSHTNAFIHYNFLSQLSDQTLPVLNKSNEELLRIDSIQEKKYPVKSYHMTSKRYKNIIDTRNSRFRKKWEAKSWLSWNYPEQVAYNKLVSINLKSPVKK